MDRSREQFLSCRHIPARLDSEEAGFMLGFLDHEITILVGVGLLKPLGKPAPNGHKYFSRDDIIALGQERAWLDKATKAVQNCWREKNTKSKTTAEEVSA